jgi:hypothetical protein
MADAPCSALDIGCILCGDDDCGKVAERGHCSLAACLCFGSIKAGRLVRKNEDG